MARVLGFCISLHPRQAHFFLIIDDDVFIHHDLLFDFVHHRDPNDLVLYGPGFCDWGVKRELKEKISEVLGMAVPEYIHIVIGGIMLFTAAAVKRFTDTTLLMQAAVYPPPMGTEYPLLIFPCLLVAGAVHRRPGDPLFE